MSGKVLIVYQWVEDSRHNKVGNPTTGISPSTSQGVCSTNNVLVEEASGPNLARDEGTTKDADEETEDAEACGIVNGPSKCGRKRSHE